PYFSPSNEPGVRMDKVRKILPIYYRSIFISDVHLGFAGCNAKYLLSFLRATRCDYLYLIGDIIDMWQMKKKLHWPQAHNDVIRTILGKAKHGTRIIYVPGNHDEQLRDFEGIVLGNLEIHNEFIHITKDNKRFLIMHGDKFDGVVRHTNFLTHIGGIFYRLSLGTSLGMSMVRRKLGFSYWSLAEVVRQKVNGGAKYIDNFETALAYAAMDYAVDGIISGHIHRPGISRVKDIVCCNCGDWVENCSALVERHDGAMELMHWTEGKQEPLNMPGMAA
ncbi:MAG: UDP-2,3-diacylglucosamine diphosphatase, partial [Gammaproteobacteria bacterium]